MAFTNSLTNHSSIDSYKSPNFILFLERDYFRDHHSSNERTRDTSRPVVIGK